MTEERLEAIKANPQATPEDLEELRRHDPQAVVSHPNCPMELWWGLVIDYPYGASETPADQLFLLEDPARWQALFEGNIEHWIKGAIRLMGAHQRHLFAADCAERVLHLYEEDIPGDDRPRKAIAARRAVAQENATTQHSWAFELAMQAATDAHRELGLPVGHFVRNAVRAACLFDAGQVASAASWAATRMFAVTGNGADDEPRRFERQTELRWQWERAQQYLRGALP